MSLLNPPQQAIGIIGVGAITPGCVGWPDTLASLRAGEPRFTSQTRADGTSRWLGGLPGLDSFKARFPQVRPPRPEALTQAVLLAALEALEDARWGAPEPTWAVGLMMDRTWDAPVTAQLLAPAVAGSPEHTRPLPFSQSVANAPLGAAARWLGLHGPNLQTMGGGAWSLARRALLDEDAASMVVVGFDGLMPGLVEAYENAGLAANGPRPRPYDPSSPGPSMSEGALAMVLTTVADDVVRPRLAAVINRGGGGPPEAGAGPVDEAMVEEAVGAALAAASLRKVHAWIGCGAGDPARDAAEQRAVWAALGGRVEPLTVGAALGEAGGLSLAAGIALATTVPGDVLVTRVDVHGACTVVVISSEGL